MFVFLFKTENIYFCFCRADKWTPLLEDKKRSNRAYHGMVAFDNLVYFIGGMTVYDGTAQYFNDTRCYDPIKGTIVTKSYMHFPRCYVACCELGTNY